MKSKKRMIITLVACALIAVMAIGGTVAYLTDKSEATNSFTFGDVKIKTIETDWDTTDKDGNGIPDVAELVVPNQEIPKTVQIKNEGVNDAVVFIKVTVPLDRVTRITDNGRRFSLKSEGGGFFSGPLLQELFYLKKNDKDINWENNYFDPEWVNLPEEEIGYVGAGGSVQHLDQTYAISYLPTSKVRTYVFGYNKRITPTEDSNGITTPLFDKVQIKNIIENEIPRAAQRDIQIETYAIQADNILNANGIIDTTGIISHDTLKEIYDIYVTQNPQFNSRPEDATAENIEVPDMTPVQHPNTGEGNEAGRKKTPAKNISETTEAVVTEPASTEETVPASETTGAETTAAEISTE